MDRSKRDSCPHCGGYCLSRWARACLGPARSVRCATCGQRVSVAWLPGIFLSLLIGVAATIGGGLAVFYLVPDSPEWWAVVFVVAGLLSSVLPALAWNRFVPLVARNAT